MERREQFKGTFLQECDEQLAQLESQLAALALPDAPAEAIHGAFRAIHSIKGGAAMLGYKQISSVAHVVEGALDQVRRGKLIADRDFIDKVQMAADLIADLADALRLDASVPTDADMAIVRELASVAAVEDISPVCGVGATVTGAPQSGMTRYRITFSPSTGAARSGLEPLRVARNLADLGELTSACDASRLPAFEDLDPVDCHLSWMFELDTEHPEARIWEVIEFAALNADVAVERLDPVPKAEATAHAQAERAANATPKAGVPQSSIRIDLERVDKLFDLVGEVTIAQSMLVQEIEKAGLMANSHVHRALSQLVQLSRSLQEGVMSIRALPVRSIFARMPRVAREVAVDLGKRVRVVTEGEDTELDKTIIEKLGDPLMHIVRNAVDHGIEPADERIAAGKPAIGTLRLSAAQKGGRIVVTVSDDGRGIDRPALLVRARSCGIVAADEELTADAIEALVFQPGISTADKVSEISGRGVGMDVVARNVQSIGGRVAIRSEPGAGCTITITLPLTLAVLDAMLVESAGQSYFIAMSHLLECLIVKPESVQSIPGAGEVISVRGEPVPFVRLSERLDGPSVPHARLRVVLVEGEHNKPVAMAVDEICGYRQIVVKSLDPQMCGVAGVSGISGATLLGDGRIGFVLDVAALTSAQTRPGNSSFKGRASQSEVRAA